MAVAVWLENSCCERSQKYLIRAKKMDFSFKRNLSPVTTKDNLALFHLYFMHLSMLSP